jgi:hypothetical protein
MPDNGSPKGKTHPNSSLLSYYPLKEIKPGSMEGTSGGSHLYGGWLYFARSFPASQEIEMDRLRYWFEQPGHMRKTIGPSAVALDPLSNS